MKISRLFIIFLISLWLLLVRQATAGEIITRVSITHSSQNDGGGSFAPSISADGRYVAFYSNATQLVADDHNGFADIFVYDRQVQDITRVSVNNRGEEANFVSFFPKLSASGRFVVFQSDASNLVANDDNGTTDIFLHDRKNREILLISANDMGELGNSTSAEPVIALNERYIAFHSDATNLVTRDTNRKKDIFTYDREMGEMQRVSIGLNGKQANGGSFGATIAGTGCYISFSSEATNLVRKDTNEATDIFLYACDTEEITRISVNTAGQAGNTSSFNSSISASGRYIAFVSRATNLVTKDTNAVEDIFLHDRETHETSRVSVSSTQQEADGASFGVTLSADGRYIAFHSDATNLVTDDDNANTDVFIHDRVMQTTQRLSLISQGPKNMPNSSFPPAISQTGRWVAFESKAWNLVANDFNEASDIFVYDRHYYATFEMATQRLYIPVLMVPGVGLFQASLKLTATQPHLQFVLEKSRAFPISLSEVPSIYNLTTGILSLPHIEIIEPPKTIRRMQAELEHVPDTTVMTFTVTKLEDRY